MLKNIGNVTCDPKDVIAWEFKTYCYDNRGYEIILFLPENIQLRVVIKPEEKRYEYSARIPNGFWRNLFNRPTITKTRRDTRLIRPVKETADKMMKEFLDE